MRNNTFVNENKSNYWNYFGDLLATVEHDAKSRPSAALFAAISSHLGKRNIKYNYRKHVNALYDGHRN